MSQESPNIPSLTTDPRRDKEEKKKGGLWAWWRNLIEGGGSVVGSGGEGAAGLEAALGGAGMGAKAGIIALMAVACSVAAVGITAWDAGGLHNNKSFRSVFAPHDKGRAEDAGAGGAGMGSLDYFKEANSGKGPGADAPAAAAAGADAAAGAAKAGAGKDASKDAAAIAAAVKASASRGVDRGDLSAKKGTLPPLAALGGSGASSGASFSTGHAAGAGGSAPGSEKGRLSAFSANGGKISGPGASSRARKFDTAGQQARRASADGQSATSSQQAGSTFDGAGAHGGTIDAGGAVPLGGAGSGGGGRDVSQDAVPTSSPGTGAEGTSGCGDRFGCVPNANDTHQNVTPWQKAIDTADELALAAIAMLLVAKFVSTIVPYGKLAATALCLGAIALGVEVWHLGNEIGGGMYGQHLQGQMFQVGGLAIAAAAASEMALGFNFMNGATILAGMVAVGALAVGYLGHTKSFCGVGETPAADHCVAGPDPNSVPDDDVFGDGLEGPRDHRHPDYGGGSGSGANTKSNVKYCAPGDTAPDCVQCIGNYDPANNTCTPSGSGDGGSAGTGGTRTCGDGEDPLHNHCVLP